MGGNTGNEKDGSKEKMVMKVSIREKSDEQDVKPKDLLIPGKSKVQKKQEKKKEEEFECDKYYTGIGITHSQHCMVTGVYKGYPAYQGGVMVGDLILSPSCEDIIGKEGTVVKLSILRGATAVHLSLIRKKICENK